MASCICAAPAPALAQTTIDFEQHPAGTVLTDQYADAGGPGQGVTFGPLPSGNPGEGLHPVIRVPPAGQAQSGSQVADIATCTGCEFFTPRTTGTFAFPRSQMSVHVGYLGDPGICTSTNPDAVTCAFVTLRVFDANGTQLAESSTRVTRGAGVKSLLSVSAPSAEIVGFEISARPTIDDSKPIAIDDLSFGDPGATEPDFTLNPASRNRIVEQGESATVPVTIGRLSGSTGDIALSASGLPPGVTADFAPNPAPGTQTTLTLNVAPTTDPGSHAVTITGTPQSASAGPGPRSFVFDLTVQAACPQVDLASELVDALAANFKCIFVAGPIDLTDELPGVNPCFIRWSEACDAAPPSLTDSETILKIPDGVTLTGGRSPTFFGGLLGVSRNPDGSMKTNKTFALKLGARTRVLGLRLQGPSEIDTSARKEGTTGIFVDGLSGSSGVGATDVVIENSEIFGWRRAAVQVANMVDCEPKTLAGCESAPRIRRNYIHHNVQCGTGYGVVIDGPHDPDAPPADDLPAGFAWIEQNVFAFNRHDIAASGGPGAGYVAELNFVQHRGPTCDDKYNQRFDVHGQHGGYRGFAGTFFDIRRNTFRGAQSYGFAGRKTRAAFELRGAPEHRVNFADNVTVHDSMGEAVQVKLCSSGCDPGGAYRLELIRRKKLVISGNDTCVDTAGELGVGDFNGDGREDVFQAVGTLWAYSPSGQREWFFLNDSDLRLRDLGLGDFNDDGRTDVFFRQGDGWFVSHGGVNDPVPLPAGSGIDVKKLRFGDFDDDGRTDVFRANGSRFLYSSAGSTDWVPLAASKLEVAKLRLGDFDGDGRTDVFSLANDQWSVSSGGSTPWRRLNRELSSKLGSLAFADFNGDGKTDVARTQGRRWEVSWGGATPWQTLSFRGSEEQLSVGMLFGDFDGDGREDVLQHSKSPRLPVCASVGSLERYRLSPGGIGPLKGWSLRDMR